MSRYFAIVIFGLLFPLQALGHELDMETKNIDLAPGELNPNVTVECTGGGSPIGFYLQHKEVVGSVTRKGQSSYRMTLFNLKAGGGNTAIIELICVQ